MDRGHISKLTLQRLPTYLSYLKSLPAQGNDAVSAAAIAGALGLGEVQVRKDLAAVSSAGRPKVGYLVSELTRDLEHFLGYGTRNRAVLVGLGTNSDRIIIGAFMTLTPGIALTNTMRDIMAGDLVAGVSKLAEALLTATAIALGTGVAVALVRLVVGGAL